MVSDLSALQIRCRWLADDCRAKSDGFGRSGRMMTTSGSMYLQRLDVHGARHSTVVIRSSGIAGLKQGIMLYVIGLP